MLDGPGARGSCASALRLLEVRVYRPAGRDREFSKPIENLMEIRPRRRARARHMVQIAVHLGNGACRMVENTARPKMHASQTQVWLETVLDTVVKPTFWWKPLWKPL